MTVLSVLRLKLTCLTRLETDPLILLMFRRDLTTNCGPDDPIPPNRVNTTENLQNLRKLMLQYNVDAYYVPLDEVGRRTWISGFSGSNGDVIITQERVNLILRLFLDREKPF